MVEPVVENPEQVSKKASAKSGMLPEITYGSAPATEAMIHEDVTIR